MRTFYVGLSTSGHDPAFAIVDEDGQVLFAEATERYLQDKRAWGALPDHAGHLASAIAQLGIDVSDARFVFATSWRRIKCDVENRVHDVLLPASDSYWIRHLQGQAQSIAGASLLRLGLTGTDLPEIGHFDHHMCHAVAACYSAPFDNAACLVIDGEGEVGAASFFHLKDGHLRRKWRSWGPGSLGTYYAWLTGQCGFDWRAGEEWKVMGLAAFGTPDPAVVARLRAMVTIRDGRIVFADDAILAQLAHSIAPLMRNPAQPVMDAADLAASGQEAYGQMVDAILASVLEDGTKNLILTGGCALNSSYNGTILRRFPIDVIHVPSAPADDGNAIGAALLAWQGEHPDRPLPHGCVVPFMGSTARPGALDGARKNAAGLQITEMGEGAAEILADRLAAGRIIGVLRGRAEFGPRALGHRSILADPRGADMAEKLNRRVKGREPYRPFAPVVLSEQCDQWFDHAQPSPYMSFTLRWRENMRDAVRAVVHRDGTGRLQTVDRQSNAWMHDLVSAFGRKTGVPVVLNTSFNVMGKPIVHSVEDAFAVLMTTGLDAIAIDDTLFEKPQPTQ